MPVFFQHLDDFKNDQLRKQSFREARKAKKGKFFFVANSTAINGPALIMTPPSGRMHPDLIRDLKKGGLPVKGTFHNMPDGGIIFLPKRPVNRRPFAEAVRDMLLSAGISIPVASIQIFTPGDVKKAGGLPAILGTKPADTDVDDDDDSDSDEAPPVRKEKPKKPAQ